MGTYLFSGALMQKMILEYWFVALIRAFDWLADLIVEGINWLNICSQLPASSSSLLYALTPAIHPIYLWLNCVHPKLTSRSLSPSIANPFIHGQRVHIRWWIGWWWCQNACRSCRINQMPLKLLCIEPQSGSNQIFRVPFDYFATNLFHPPAMWVGLHSQVCVGSEVVGEEEEKCFLFARIF